MTHKLPKPPPKSTSFDLGVLVGLPQSMLDQIIARARALVTFGRGVDNPVNSGDNHEWLLTGVLRELQSRGLNGSIPVAAIMNLREYKHHFAVCAPSMDAWLRKQVPADTDRATLMSLSRLAAECLAARIETKFRAPVCLSTMLRFYIQVPDAIEEGFPSYCRNKWLPLLLTQKGRGR